MYMVTVKAPVSLPSQVMFTDDDCEGFVFLKPGVMHLHSKDPNVLMHVWPVSPHFPSWHSSTS